MPRRSTTVTRQGLSFVIPPFSTEYKFTITRSDGTVDNVTSIISNMEIEDGVTELIGNFKFTIYDPNDVYKGVWVPPNIVYYYKDYATTATSCRFRGRVEKVEYGNGTITVSGRSDSLRLMEITVTKAYSNMECSEILIDLLTVYAPDFTYANVSQSGVSLTVSWVQKPFWECVQELCTASGFDAYLDNTLDFNFFQVGTRLNQYDCVVHEHNMLDMTGFTTNDSSQVRNRIIVYGATIDGIQPFAMAEDEGSQADNFAREEIVNDDNITTDEQAQEYADFLLAQKKDAPTTGTVTAFLLATVQPGEAVMLGNTLNNMPPNYYNVASYKDTIDIEGGDLTTELRVSKEPRKVSHVIKNIIQRNSAKQDTSANPENMRYSYIFTFDEDTGTHGGTQIASGTLLLLDGQTEGSWVSPLRTVSANITAYYLIANGSQLDGATFDISLDNGLTFNTGVSLKTLTEPAVADQGSNIVIRVNLNNSNVRIDSLSLQYKF